MRTVNDLIRGLNIMAEHFEKGRDQENFIKSVEGGIFFPITNKQIIEHSVAGAELQDIGFHYNETELCWGWYT